ncbi:MULTISPECIES: asparaginase [Rathayibacter]|jgi:L-asparaginase II|uniref:Asparaginase n=1 Tax=Rathayibacter festucae DSM 15932 TaxID=1328866 RepID=A0A3Q9UPJ7_9MICO|nr:MULTISPECIES: asparaginase [Rathayibacter]AZZ51190.1 asparaginase [Rathayibacter festucae DSM 15932]MCJ1672956.1 asparaginase [Rathayibacter sp. VKM Ac-2929]MCJ1682452.1 asparaginase [Rathayibacter sp. VKM Ac-2928]MCJ1685627.1 asparaginase [Rathayibacter sp. VKM Ac-2927]ROS29343.1 asparaginase [Rathayibacter sp. PhB127]
MSAGTFTLAESVELAVVERSGFVESRHAGSAVLLDSDGRVARTLGTPTAPVLPRSCLKPFQALAVMTAGVELSGAEAVIATASHAGIPQHVALVQNLLFRAGLDHTALQCPADWPSDSASRTKLLRAGASADPLYMNCSGKHAAMLLACVQNGWSTDDYLERSHPLQQHIVDTIERLTGERIAGSAVDGCGAPVHALPLTALAKGISRIVSSSPASPFGLYRQAGVLTEAILENAWALDGPGRDNTVVIERLGLVAKLGAEGVLVMASPDGTTVALKILDGSLRAATVVALKLLVEAGTVDRTAANEVLVRLNPVVTGGGKPVGAVRASYV